RPSAKPEDLSFFQLLPEPKVFGHSYFEQIWKKYTIGLQTRISDLLAKKKLLGLLEHDGTMNYNQNMIIPRKTFIKYQFIENPIASCSSFSCLSNNTPNIKEELKTNLLIGVIGSINQFSNPETLVNVIEDLRSIYPNLNISILCFAKSNEQFQKPWMHFRSYDKLKYLMILKQVDFCVNTWKNKCVIYSGSNKNLDCISSNVPIILPFSYSYIDIFGKDYPLFYNAYDPKLRYTQLSELIEKIIKKQIDMNIIQSRYSLIKKHLNTFVLSQYSNQIQTISNEYGKRNKIRILILQNNLNIGGAQKYGMEIARSLCDEEIIMALTENYDESKEIAKLRSQCNLKNVRIMKYNDLFITFENYDVCYINSVPMGPPEGLNKLINHLRPLCGTLNVIIHNTTNPFSQNIFALKSNIIDNHIVVHSKLNEIIKNTVVHKNILIIYPSLDNFSCKPKTVNHKVLCYYGRILPAKGVKLLLMYWNILHHKYPLWKLRISGNCIPTTREFLDECLKYVATNNLSDGVILDIKDINTAEEKLEIYQNIDYLIQLSFSEGLPYTILESFAHNIPVIHTDVGGVSEVVNKNTGYLLNFKGLPTSSTKDWVPLYNEYFNDNLIVLEKCFSKLLTKDEPVRIDFRDEKFLGSTFNKKLRETF
ncbi:MAG: glycosyltransferase family 4 protein, partial [Candidatus Paceibacterota bacterium]